MDEVMRIGLVNIMPNPSAYQELILESLANIAQSVQIIPVDVKGKNRSRKGETNILTTQEAELPLDLVIITGAPVEHLPYPEIHYWHQLSALISYAEQNVRSVLGICFGGLAIAKHLGIDKRVRKEKAFGAYELTVSSSARAKMLLPKTPVVMAISTWALLNESDVLVAEQARVSTIAAHPELGSVVMESVDRKFLIVLGHPEYRRTTLRAEWERDRAKHIGYTRKLSEASFIEVEQQLAHGGCDLVERWVRSHARFPPAT